MARRLTSSDWDAVLGSSSLRRISERRPWVGEGSDWGGRERKREWSKLVLQKASSEVTRGLLGEVEHPSDN